MGGRTSMRSLALLLHHQLSNIWALVNSIFSLSLKLKYKND
jgi:hypothetical protein